MKLKTSNVTVTPKMAEEYLRLNTYPGQRNISARHVAELGEKMKDGRFHEGQIALVHNGSTFLANGQHQCTAAVASGSKFNARLLEYTCEKGDTKEDVARVFSQFNVDRSRTRGDIAWIYGCQIGMEDWPRQCVTLCCAALGWIAAGFPQAGKANGDKDAVARLLSAKRASCAFIRQVAFCDGAGDKYRVSRHLLRVPAIAAMIVTHSKAASDAEVFWTAVRDGDMLKRSDPCFTLREFLMRAALNSKSSRDSSPIGAREMFGKCIHAWNAYRQKSSTALKYFGNKPLPKAV